MDYRPLWFAGERGVSEIVNYTVIDSGIRNHRFAVASYCTAVLAEKTTAGDRTTPCPTDFCGTR